MSFDAIVQYVNNMRFSCNVCKVCVISFDISFQYVNILYALALLDCCLLLLVVSRLPLVDNHHSRSSAAEWNNANKHAN